MRDIEGIETVLQKLKPHWDAIQEHFEEENARFKELLAREHDSLGRVLKCHLIVERYLERFLTANYRIQDLEGIRLSFFQKGQLLPGAGTAAAFVKPGVLKLNSIRNHFVHTLDTEIREEDLGPINEVLGIARHGVVFEDAIKRIEAFTTIACTFLVVAPPDLQGVFMDAFSEVRVNTR